MRIFSHNHPQNTFGRTYSIIGYYYNSFTLKGQLKTRKNFKKYMPEKTAKIQGAALPKAAVKRE